MPGCWPINSREWRTTGTATLIAGTAGVGRTAQAGAGAGALALASEPRIEEASSERGERGVSPTGELGECKIAASRSPICELDIFSQERGARRVGGVEAVGVFVALPESTCS